MQAINSNKIPVNKTRDLLIFISTISLIIFFVTIFTYNIYIIFFAPYTYEEVFPMMKGAILEVIEQLKIAGKIPYYDLTLMSKVIEAYANYHADILTNKFLQNHNINWKQMAANITTYPDILHFVIRQSIAALAKAGITDYQTAAPIFDALRIQILENFDQLDKVCECIAEGLDKWTKDFNARPKFDSFKYPELRFMNNKWHIQHGKLEFLKSYVNANLHRFVIR
jgi:hypothetical protein